MYIHNYINHNIVLYFYNYIMPRIYGKVIQKFFIVLELPNSLIIININENLQIASINPV